MKANRKIGNPEIFDLIEEYPETNWGKKLRLTRLVFRKVNGSLEFHTYGGDHRPNAFILQIKNADRDLNFKDFDYIRLYTLDNNPWHSLVEASKEPVFSQCQIKESSYCCKKFNLKQFHPDLIICPDFQFHKWLYFDYYSYVKKIREAGRKNPFIDKVCWRGLARPEHSNRKLLCEMTDLHPELIDAKHTGLDENQNDYLPLKEMILAYRYVIDTQAHGFSGRLKYLMNSNRLLFMQDRFYTTFIEEKIKPWVHYIPVKYDFSDLVEKIQWAKENNEESKKIIKEMYKFSKEHLSIDAINQKWKNLLENI